jgi:hypothetical protein
VCPISLAFCYKTAGFEAQHMHMKLSIKLGKTVTQTYVILKLASKEQTMSRIFGF